MPYQPSLCYEEYQLTQQAAKPNKGQKAGAERLATNLQTQKMFFSPTNCWVACCVEVLTCTQMWKPSNRSCISYPDIFQTSLSLNFHTGYNEEGQPKYDEMQHGTGRHVSSCRFSDFEKIDVSLQLVACILTQDFETEAAVGRRS